MLDATPPIHSLIASRDAEAKAETMIRGLLSLALVVTVAPAAAEEFSHAGYLANLGEEQFKRGQRLYQGLCVNCHGADGKTPSLPQAPAFGEGTLKFGADAHAMFQTLTKGNGLMAPQQWMTPQERYDVIHYIREHFMKGRPDHVAIDEAYLADLPVDTEETSSSSSAAEKDFGPALASQLERNLESVLTIKLPDKHAIAYDLHTMNVAHLWKDGYLDLANTQHYRLRGEGVPKPEGEPWSERLVWEWAHEGTFDYPTETLLPRGPLPEKWMHYHGHYLHGDQVILAYQIDGREILESPQKQARADAMVQALTIGPSSSHLKLAIGQIDSTYHVANEPVVAYGDASGLLAIALLGDTSVLSHEHEPESERIVLTIAPSDEWHHVEIIRTASEGQGQPAIDAFGEVVRYRQLQGEGVADLRERCRGAAARWIQTFPTQTVRSDETEPYVIDTLPHPEVTPWNTWFRTSALDFAADGRLFVATHGGDVWLIRGASRASGELEWKRYAAGLYEPFGLCVVGNDVYATCKDRLVRLQDLNGDDEADFYESFSADDDVSTFFHAYNFDLVRDRAGHFYYVKAGQYTSHTFPGAVVKVSADGTSQEIVATGFRTPNGMGILPDDRLTVSDNQGNWIPASKVSLIRPGGYYGYAQTHARPGLWAPDGGRIDHTEEPLPKTFDQPLIWLPQHVDNSSGGQLWVEDDRWGPLANRLLHTSFGKGWLYYFHLQDFGDVAQAAAIKVPLDFDTGIMRARVNPADGQVYTVGLNGWNGNGRKGLGEGGLYRIRYTGKPMRMITDAKVRDNGLELHFNFPTDPKTADLQIEQWNYRWLPRYGSDNWSPNNPNQKGKDAVEVSSVENLSNDRGLFLEIPDLQPVNQLHLKVRVQSAAKGDWFEEELYWTINGLPNGRRWQQPAPYREKRPNKQRNATGPWIRLFDGATLTGWSALAEGDVTVYNGEIQIRSEKNLWLLHERAFENFILEAEVKLPSDAKGINSGIGFRCRGAESKPIGYQCEIDGTDRRWSGGLHAIGDGWVWPKKGDAASEGRFMEMAKGSFRRDEWNRFRIECRGTDIRLFVNGIPTTAIDDDRFQRGHIALQHHGRGGVYRFRDIRVQPLD